MIDAVMTEHSGWYNLAHCWQALLGLAFIVAFGLVLYISSFSTVEVPDEDEEEDEDTGQACNS